MAGSGVAHLLKRPSERLRFRALKNETTGASRTVVVGARAFVVDALNDDAERFNRDFGFA